MGSRVTRVMGFILQIFSLTVDRHVTDEQTDDSHQRLMPPSCIKLSLVSRWLFAELIKESLNGFPGIIYTPIGGGTPPIDVNTPPNSAPPIGSVRTVLVVYSYTA